MKYFNYYIWDNDQRKDTMVLPRENSIYGFHMKYLGEIIDGKNYDLITGEEITYCTHPYLGRLSFGGYQLVSPGEVKMMLEKLSPNDVKIYKNEIYRIKKQSSKMNIKDYQNSFISNDGSPNPTEDYIESFKKKNRKFK